MTSSRPRKRPRWPSRGPAALALGLFLAGCGSQEPPSTGVSQADPGPEPARIEGAPTELGPWGGLNDEAAARGLDYLNRSGEPEKATVLEANGAGVAALDLGGDGDLDLVFAQGLGSLGELVEGPGADLEVFENLGQGRFERRAGPGLSGWWSGLASGDVDGDGDVDLVAGGYGGLRVLLQDDSGQLVPSPAGDLLPEGVLLPGTPHEQGSAPSWVSSLALFDADRDGNLDLYVGRYLDLDPLAPPIGKLGDGPLAVPCRWKGHQVFCGPSGMQAQEDVLFRGRGDGGFERRTDTWVEDPVSGFTLGVQPFDADGDGDTDLYVACDSVSNQLLINDGKGRFIDVAFSAGVALSQDGAAEAGMGVAIGDVDRDGRMDLAVTNFSGEPTGLYLGGQGLFENATFRTGLGRETRDLLSWGVHLVDFDGDGWLELFTANGHVYPQADRPDTGTRYGQAASLWRLGPSWRAERVAPHSEASLLAPELGARGSALGDFDGDGDVDLVLARIDGPAALGINAGRPGANLLALRCLGPLRGETVEGASAGRTPADGMGTRVVVVPALLPGQAPEQQHGLLAEVQTAAGYQSASSPWIHVSLGSATSYETIQVHWPSGRVLELEPGPAGRRLVLREGRGIVSEEPLP